MKSSPQCPICFDTLRFCEVAPCWDCGDSEDEIEHLQNGIHTYSFVSILGLELVLCNFCMVDFSSYDPAFLGMLPTARRLSLGRKGFEVLRPVDNPKVESDFVCRICRHRVKFLNFLVQLREINETNV